MLQEYLKLNKNILIAFAASITISAIIAQLLSEQTEYLNATYTTIADYVIYFSVFTFFCLLYTSPSPRDGLLSRMPSSA